MKVMRKRIITFLIAIVMLFGMTCSVYAVDDSLVPYSSEYLDAYYVALTAEGNGKMLISMAVDGVGIQDKIGVLYIDIEEKRNGTWNYFDTLYSADHDDFFAYNARQYMGSATFYGTPGLSYRVTIHVYARKGSGSDTGELASYITVCK